LFASYVDDPSAHPDEFPTEDAQQAERERLFKIIEDLVKWENSTNEEVLKAAREEIRKSCGDEPPPVYDPFCGGGSIPLEAQRLGLTAYASDLNPVAVLITKALVEIPPKFAGQPPVHPDNAKLKGTSTWTGVRGLAEDVRYYGKWMRDEAQERIGHIYPKVKLPPEHGGGEGTVIAWIWARTVKSPNPAWDGPMPLVRSFALSTKNGKETWVQPIIDRENKRIRFVLRSGPGCPEGTVGRNGAVCLATGSPVPLSYIRDEAKSGRMGQQLMAIVADSVHGRVYVPASNDHERVALSVLPPDDVPDTSLPDKALGFRVQAYGMLHHRELFTARQLTALATFSDLVGEARRQVLADGAAADVADGVAVYLALAESRLADSNNALCSWSSARDQTRNLFARQAVPMVWDFVENNPFAEAAGDLGVSIASGARSIEMLPASSEARVEQLDASALRQDSPVVFVTDPPYYDNIGYADLSDFFYIWLRRAMREVFPDIFSTLLVPKAQELIASPFRHGGSRKEADSHFERGIGEAFVSMRNAQREGFPLTVIYAFKQAEDSDDSAVASTGWETMLEGLLRAGLSVHGTWPLRSERGGRMVSIGTNALASSIALVCRPRPETAGLATRKDFLGALKSELPGALRHLQQGSIAPVDLAQAAIGPGMAVFSRYSKVVEADGSVMSVRTALGLINQVLDETLAEQEADFDGDTRWAVAWFEQYGVNPGPFGIAETLSKAKNTAINGLVAAGILESKAGKVRLLDRAELPGSWDPTTDGRLTVWELAQHLIGALESGGENDAADLLRRIGGLGETARELAYRLYVICERRKWSKEAIAYNALVVAWPELSRLAASPPASSGPAQQELL
jgi:putative DNA methylase